MVLGHTLEALLSSGVRTEPWVQRVWELRGITAPLFLLVSGWAVVMALGTERKSAEESFGRRAWRALMLLFLGYLLQWPGWDTVLALGWGEELRSRLFAFEALQSIGVSLLVGSALLVLARGPWSRAVVLGVLAVGVPLAAPWVWSEAARLPVELRQALGTAGARFPLFPWMGFFFAGAFAAHLLRLLRPGGPQGLALLALGGGLLVLSGRLPADWNSTSAWWVAFRAGQGLLVLGAVNLAPLVLCRLLAPWGRASLGLYALHLPLVYGWAGLPGLAGRVGPTLELGPALLVGLALLAVCFAGVWLARALRREESSTTWRVRPMPLGASSLRSGQRV
jgi:acyltransferase